MDVRRGLFGSGGIGKLAAWWPIVIVGLLGYLILGWWAIRISTVGQHSVGARLDWAAQAALDRAGIPWARVQIDGQAATLTGSAPNQAARDRAMRVVLHSTGGGGLVLGGVTKVRDRTVIAGEPVAPLHWRAARAPGGKIELTGAAPSVAERSDLVTYAEGTFKTQVVDSMSAAQGAAQTGWAGAARLGIELMAQLPDGEAEIAGRRLTVRGTAPTEETAAAALARLKALPAPFVGESAIVTAMEIPELQGVKLAASGATAGECQTAFSRIMARNTINFDVASAVVAADSRSVLDKLAFVSKRCSRFRIDVAGHTDSTGAREDNLRLSKARANAVAEYLTAQGVAADRVSAHGFGPDRPLAPNNDPAGMAKNRRIEFTVRADGAL